MKPALLLVVTGLTLAVAVSACNQDKSDKDEQDPAATAGSEEIEVGELSVADLAGLLEDENAKVAVLDSNGDKTRKQFGKIPNATLLSDYKKFDKSELPREKDAKLVFYCSNTQCGASHASAGVAMSEGYKDVNILPAGIMGWKEAGQKTETVQ